MNKPLGPSSKASIKEAPKIEIKSLPSHLKYAFFGDDDTLPIILSTCLYDVPVKKALTIRKRRKKVIRWNMSDIQNINPTFYIHKITMEEDDEMSFQYLERLILMIKEVVRKEVIKWLDAGVVYPILCI